MAYTPHILLVEDDREISALISRFLNDNKFRVSKIDSGREIDAILARNKIDLIVLDLMLPGEDGFSICARLRKTSTIPIIMLTAKSEEADRIAGLELGADDYLPKPFNPRELLARIRAVLRRGGGQVDQDQDMVLTFDGWRLDTRSRHLNNPYGVRIILTGAEFKLLQVLCQRPRQTLSRDQLLDLTQGRSANLYERSIDILVSRLRQKIEPDPSEPKFIQTIRSAGYVFSADVERDPVT